jgi:predicted DNA-binding transcriptional regulator YafY
MDYLAPIEIDYLNWQQERRSRRIQPIQLWLGCTQWHPQCQWLLRAYDIDDDGKVKDFAMSGIYGWRALNTEGLNTG